TRKGAELTASVPVPRELITAAGAYSGLLVGFLVPTVGKFRGVTSTTQSQSNLKQIALAIHNYHDVNGHFPRDITDKNGKPILSWRVAILPFIEQQPLYNRFKLDQPWEGPNNKEAPKAVIKTYLSPSEPKTTSPDGYGLTSYKGVAGPGTIFDRKAGKLRLIDITDGTANTVMLIEAGDPIPWAKPGDFEFDLDKPLPKLQSPGLADAFNAALADASVRRIATKKPSEKTIKPAFTPAAT